MRLIGRIPGTITKATMAVACAAAGIMVVLVTAGVIARYALNRPFAFVEEYSIYLIVLVVCWGLSYTLKSKGHIRITVLITKFPASAARWLELGAYIVATGYSIIFTVQLARMTQMSFADGTRSFGAMLTPLGPVQLLMVIGVGAIALEFAVEMIGKIAAIVKGEAASVESETGQLV